MVLGSIELDPNGHVRRRRRGERGQVWESKRVDRPSHQAAVSVDRYRVFMNPEPYRSVMAMSARSSTRVSERLIRLRRAYDSVPLRQTSIVVDTPRYEQAIERLEDGSVTQITVRVVNGRGEVLLGRRR